MTSCSADSIFTTKGPGPIGIQQLSPPSLIVKAGDVANPEPTIRVVDLESGKPVAGVTVDFEVLPGGGSVERTTATTGASGVVSPGNWRVGERPGNANLIAHVGDINAQFVARIVPNVPAEIRTLAEPMVGVAGQTVEGPRVLILDRFGNPLTNTRVGFSVVDGDAAVVSPFVQTDAYAVATTGIHLRRPGFSVVAVSVEGLVPAQFVAPALDPAAVTQYAIDSIREDRWDGSLGRVWMPGDLGVQTAVLTITQFDRCLCRREKGFLILDASFWDKGDQWPQRTGEYTIDPPAFSIQGTHINSIAFMKDRIELTVQRDTLDWRWTEIWIFKIT